jgi:hypothetical protein
MKSMLYNYVRWDDNTNVNKVLDQHLNIDLMSNEGIYFTLAIKHNNTEMLIALFEYYEQMLVKKYEVRSIEYNLAKHKLSEVLQKAVDSFDISEEMQKILTPYLPQEGDVDSQEGLSDIEATTGQDTALYDENFWGKTKEGGKYNAKTHEVIIELYQQYKKDNVECHNISKAIRYIEKEFLNRSTDGCSIPVANTMRGWIKEYLETEQSSAGHFDFDKKETSNLTFENLQNLSNNKEEKVLSSTSNDDFNIANLFVINCDLKQDAIINLTGENISFENPHNVSTDSN